MLKYTTSKNLWTLLLAVMFLGMSFLPQRAESAYKNYIFEFGQYEDNGIFSWNESFLWSGFGEPVGGDVVSITPSRPSDVTMIYNSTVDYSSDPLGSLYIRNTGGGQLFFDMTSESPPSLHADMEYIGVSGNATFNQSAGSNVVTGWLRLGFGSESNGTYNLSETGSLSAQYEFVGREGNGTFNQSGGNNTVGANLILGMEAGAGAYNLSDGNLSADLVFLGYSGSGTFNQSGGDNTTSDLYLGGSADWPGWSYDSDGTYNLSNGALSTSSEVIGIDGTGTFAQSGGTNSVAEDLVLGDEVGSSGTYDLSNGNLSAETEIIGSGGSGTFTQSGGEHTVTYDLTIAGDAGSSGTYNLIGGTLAANSVVNNDTFNYSGGALHLSVAGWGTFVNNGGFNASGIGTRSVNGDFTNNGTFKATDTNVVFTGTFTNNGSYISDPSNNYFADLIIGEAGYLVGGVGDNFYLSGDFLNSSMQYDLWDTVDAYLGFQGTGAHEFYLAQGSFAEDFSWGALELLDGGSLTFSGIGFTDFYVDNLILSAGSNLYLGGMNLYYGSLTNLGGSYAGGNLIALNGTEVVPVPGAVLLGMIGLSVAGVKLRRHA